ncbi:unnamed protein product [Closterium sp. NIES-54]
MCQDTGLLRFKTSPLCALLSPLALCPPPCHSSPQVHFAATVAALTLHFAACGEIRRVTILTHPLTGRPRGCAYIEFAIKEAVDKALALNDASFMSRPLKIIHKPHAALEALASATAPPITPTRPARPLLTPTKLPAPALGTSPTALASPSARPVPAKAQGVGVKAQGARRPSARGSLQWKRQPEVPAAPAAAAAVAPRAAGAAPPAAETKFEGKGGVIGNSKEAVQKATANSAPVAAASAGEIEG